MKIWVIPFSTSNEIMDLGNLDAKIMKCEGGTLLWIIQADII